jgi:hypothetical protein
MVLVPKLMVARRRTSRWIWPALWLALIAFLALPPRSSQAAPTAFRFGQRVEAHSPGVAINLRGEPGLAGQVVDTLPNGTPLTVIDGPRQVDDANWWLVDGGATYGWAAEGLLRPAPSVPAPDAAARRANCVVVGPVYPGVYHCQRANRVHVVVIDLKNPHVRFETVMAHDVADTHSPIQEWVASMAARRPGAVAAINGDYFGPGEYGPEGLTIRNGARLDNLPVLERSALVIGQAPLDASGAALPIPAEIVRPSLAGSRLDPLRAHNAIGGGPQIVFDSVWRWSVGFGFPGYHGCARGLPPTQVVNGECLANVSDWREPDTPWSAAGLTPDHKLVWVVGPYAHMAETLQAFGVETALKLDGGGSSQLWYGRTMVHGFRPVANGLLVFYQRSAEVVEQSHWPVSVAGRAGRLSVTLRNTGADTWRAGEVALARPGAAPLALPRAVRPGDTVTLTWRSAPVAHCGINREVWQLTSGAQPFPGPAVTFDMIVLPTEMAAQQHEVSAAVNAWLGDAVNGDQPPIVAALETAGCARQGVMVAGQSR